MTLVVDAVFAMHGNLFERNSMSNEHFIDRGTYYEIKDYIPIVSRDENGKIVGMIYCPYVPKRLVDSDTKAKPTKP